MEIVNTQSIDLLLEMCWLFIVRGTIGDNVSTNGFKFSPVFCVYIIDNTVKSCLFISQIHLH